MLPAFKAQSIGAENNIPLTGQQGTGMVHGVPGETGTFGLPQAVLVIMLMPDGDSRIRGNGIPGR
jgi:hypothetical protein